MADNLIRQALKNDADQCVKCGVCLPHCPTYALRKEEAESPRGRITLMQGLASGQLPLTEDVKLRLGHCLSCGRCEDVCPANVSYGRLMDGSRHVFQTTPNTHKRKRHLVARLLSSSHGLLWCARLARVAKTLQLHKILKPPSLAGRLLHALPNTNTAKAPSLNRQSKNPSLSTSAVPGATGTRTPVWLFSGCLTTAFERDIIYSAMRIGERTDISFQLPDKALCCGALYQHLGDNTNAQQLTRQTIQAYKPSPEWPVATLLSGCGKGLHDNLMLAKTAEATALGLRLRDVMDLLLPTLLPQATKVFRKSRECIAIYHPCTAQRTHAARLLQLLQTVAEVDVIELDKGFGCCGASGDHMLVDPAAADKLADPVIRAIVASGVSTVLTSNLGCAWHLRANLASLARPVTVIHPLQWLAQHLL